MMQSVMVCSETPQLSPFKTFFTALGYYFDRTSDLMNSRRDRHRTWSWYTLMQLESRLYYPDDDTYGEPQLLDLVDRALSELRESYDQVNEAYLQLKTQRL
jgi:hypothetical protein